MAFNPNGDRETITKGSDLDKLERTLIQIVRSDPYFKIQEGGLGEQLITTIVIEMNILEEKLEIVDNPIELTNEVRKALRDIIHSIPAEFINSRATAKTNYDALMQTLQDFGEEQLLKRAKVLARQNRKPTQEGSFLELGGGFLQNSVNSLIVFFPSLFIEQNSPENKRKIEIFKEIANTFLRNFSLDRKKPGTTVDIRVICKQIIDVLALLIFKPTSEREFIDEVDFEMSTEFMDALESIFDSLGDPITMVHSSDTMITGDGFEDFEQPEKDIEPGLEEFKKKLDQLEFRITDAIFDDELLKLDNNTNKRDDAIDSVKGLFLTLSQNLHNPEFLQLFTSEVVKTLNLALTASVDMEVLTDEKLTSESARTSEEVSNACTDLHIALVARAVKIFTNSDAYREMPKPVLANRDLPRNFLKLEEERIDSVLKSLNRNFRRLFLNDDTDPEFIDRVADELEEVRDLLFSGLSHKYVEMEKVSKRVFKMIDKIFRTEGDKEIRPEFKITEVFKLQVLVSRILDSIINLRSKDTIH